MIDCCCTLLHLQSKVSQLVTLSTISLQRGSLHCLLLFVNGDTSSSKLLLHLLFVVLCPLSVICHSSILHWFAKHSGDTHLMLWESSGITLALASGCHFWGKRQYDSYSIVLTANIACMKIQAVTYCTSVITVVTKYIFYTCNYTSETLFWQ